MYDSIYIRYPEEPNCRDRKQNGSARGWGEGRDGNYCLICTVSVWDDEKLLETDDRDGHTMGMGLLPLNYTFKNGNFYIIYSLVAKW